MEGPSSVSIRPLQDGDFQAWKSLWNEYLEFYETTVEDLVYETSIGRMLEDQNISQNALVAEKERAIVGLVHFIFAPTQLEN